MGQKQAENAGKIIEAKAEGKLVVGCPSAGEKVCFWPQLVS